MKAISSLARLEKIRTRYVEDIAAEKLSLLRLLHKQRLGSARQLIRLHDLGCYFYAYPDNQQIFRTARDILNSFAQRSDLKRYRGELINSGMAGTAIHYQFYWPMACWLAENCAPGFEISWNEIEDTGKLQRFLPLIISPAEIGVIDEFDFDARGWLKRLKCPDETDAGFLVKRLQNTFATDYERESFHDDLNLDYVLNPGPDTPNISNVILPKVPVRYQTENLHGKRPDLRDAITATRFRIKKLGASHGKRLVDLARKTMLTHERDLDSFSYGNPADVRLVDFDDGYQIACIGMQPGRRYLLHSTYGFLNMKNGLPVGYFQISGVFNYAEVAFNLFAPFRGAEASHIFSRNLAVAHQVFEMNSFSLDPYQLGHGNADGLKSGVWWFYYKLGFRPMDEDIQALLQREINKIGKNPGYRSSMTTLDKLASVDMFFSLSGRQEDYYQCANLGYLLLGISDYLSSRFGAAREAGLLTCVTEAMAITGITASGRMSAAEHAGWLRWSPLVLVLGSVRRWPAASRRQLADIIKARNRDDELDYLKRVNHHKLLRRRILALSGRLAGE